MANEAGAQRAKYWLLVAGLLLALAGGWLAQSVRTTGGTAVTDVRFTGAGGQRMSALLYVPAGASPESKAPGILAVHGYINSRETQDGFAIEFARRGYVVLALDQTGHGYSDGPAFAHGFGGPDGLAYLRSLPMVDTDNIGLEGHSMGGWTVLAAAAAMPDAYRSVVLEGSSTGAPFAQEGSPQWPRNLGLVFSTHDEFSALMWGTPRALDVAKSEKLQAVFGTEGPVVAGQTYGDIAAGTARRLYQPVTTHPGDHFSHAAIGDATDWFARTLEGGKPLPATDQTWLWKEIGTGIGLVGFVLVLLGAFDLLLRLPGFAALRGVPTAARETRDKRWWRDFALATLVPALLFFPVFGAVYLLVPVSAALPQQVTTQVTAWALLVAAIGLAIARFTEPKLPDTRPHWLRTALLAIASVAAGYAALWLADALFLTDFRLWVVAIKLPAMHHWTSVAIYLVPLTLAMLAIMRTLAGLTVAQDGTGKRMLAAVAALAAGMAAMLAAIYGIFFVSGTLVTAFDPLSTVIAIQFVPVLAALAVIGTFVWRRTGSYRPAGLMAGLLVTLYVVAGTATQA
ncbi:alpha/beta fold hydrolase [Qipengyuania sp. YG27]|uniref:Alpha/beta fold hydrolase n=1 Tax=Qipengyuania mesophila TaxID=2867246 RepID=A0ABS7JWC8_9SPHN|nr:alpha/beta hydrolase [Qipengyuania mesophila]MBX7501882.1 alpha/beta fold hydrolase [Qipengyuania mesophila]